MARKTLEWHVCETGTETNWDKLVGQFSDQDTVSSSPGTALESSKTHYLYELICGIALLCGIVVYLLWQQTAQRIVRIEREIAALRADVAAFQQSGLEREPAATYESRNRPFHLATASLEKAINSREIKPQWRGMTLALKTTAQFENDHNRIWQWADTHLLHRYNAQSHSLNLVFSAPELLGEQSLPVNPIIYATASPLAEFILSTYGYDKVPELLDAFEEHDAWETIAPALFHLSAKEFQEQWHAYLRKHYPIPK